MNSLLEYANSSRVIYDPRPDHKDSKKFTVGIRFEPLNIDFLKEKGATQEAFIRKKHWAVVFTTSTLPRYSFRVELQPGPSKGLKFVATSIDEEHYAHPIGTWTGSEYDIKCLMENHPMNKSWVKYSPCFNNCQHWAATLLVFLETRSEKNFLLDQFNIDHRDRYEKVLSIIKQNGEWMHNRPNPLFKGASITSLAVSGVVGGALGVAATATVTTTTAIQLPAAGIMGLLGATSTVEFATVTAAAGAAGAAVAFPIFGGVALAGGLIFLGEVLEWKEKTKFKDPRLIDKFDFEAMALKLPFLKLNS